MYEVYLWNKNTNNRVLFAVFNTLEEAQEYIRKNTTDVFQYYVKEKKQNV